MATTTELDLIRPKSSKAHWGSQTISTHSSGIKPNIFNDRRTMRKFSFKLNLTNWSKKKTWEGRNAALKSFHRKAPNLWHVRQRNKKRRGEGFAESFLSKIVLLPPRTKIWPDLNSGQIKNYKKAVSLSARKPGSISNEWYRVQQSSLLLLSRT